MKHPVSGEVLFTSPEQTISELHLVIIDDNRRKTVMVHLRPTRARPLVLWQGAAYDEAGDYTQAQVETRVLELLGADPAAVIANLIQR